MVSEEPTRITTKRLRKAGFVRTNSAGSHSKWEHPLGLQVSIADGHRTTSPGIVRQVNQAIDEADRLEAKKKERKK